MSGDDGDGDSYLLKRAREVLASWGESRSPSMLDAVTQQVGESLTRWRDSAALRRFLGIPLGRDQVIAAGRKAWLEARVGPVVQLGAAEVRFWLSGKDVGRCAVSDEGASGIEVTIDTPGLYTLALEPLSSGGTSLAPAGFIGESRVHAVADTPVLAVDARLLLEPDPDSLSILRQAPRHGAQLFYFDLDPADRTAAICEAIATHGLPDGAVLSHPDQGKDLDVGSTDFSRVFGITTVRRLRASGVPVVAGVNTADARARAASSVGQSSVALLRPIELTPPALRRLAAEASDFVGARDQTEDLTWRLDQATRTKLVAGNALHVEFDNHRARERVFALIDDAQRSIHLQTYILQEGQVSNALIVRLIKRARAGVRVRIVVDALYSGEQVLGRKNPMLDSLALEPNVEVAVGAPIEFSDGIDSVKLKQRDHRKLLIIDGSVGIVSGRNIGDAYYRGFDETPIHQHTSHDHIPWLDAHVEATGPILRDIEATFLEAWKAYGGSEHSDLTPGDHDTTGSSCARIVVHRGLVDANAMLQYEAMLDAATRHIYIVNDFPIVQSLAAAMMRALSRGVTLTLLTGNAVARRADGTFFPGPVYRELFDHMVKQRLEPLIRRGAKVFEFVAPPHPMVVAEGGIVRPYVHAKVMTCDGKVASVGSANLDATASYWEHEANLVVQDEAFATALEAEIDAMTRRAHVIDLDSDYWKRERSKRTIVSKLWPESVYS